MSAAAAVYDRPELLAAVSFLRRDGLREMLLRIGGLHCGGCVRRVETALRPLVRSATVNLAAGTLEVVFDAHRTPPSKIVSTIERLGFHAFPLGEQAELRETQAERRRMILRLGVAALLGMQVMMLAATQYFADGGVDPALELLLRYAQWIMATPVLLYSGQPFFANAWRALRAFSVNMDVPVALAMLLAYAASAVHVVRGTGHVYFDSVTMFAALLLAARWFESSGRAEASRRLRELGSAQPLIALRETPQGVREAPALQLAPGDVLLVPPGSALAADGRLLSRRAQLDESLLTGEALPVARHGGEAVLGGSVNTGNEPLRVQVSATASGSAISQIARLMNRAQQEKPRVQQLADRAAGYVVTAVLVLAAAAAAWWWPQGPGAALGVALAVLVVTCPCALSLATPVALAASTSALARRGVLVTRADALLRLPDIDTVCFDKTGTITTGRMRIERRAALAGAPEPAHCLRIAAALERGLRHPVATAFAGFDAGLPVEAVEMLPGTGVRGRIEGADYELRSGDGEEGLTWVHLLRDGVPIARFGLAHALRPESAEVVAALQTQGLSTALLSGDNERTVADAVRALGLGEGHARLKPQDKLAYVRTLQGQGHRVWMIGDGINDAPVLAAADVSAALAGGAALAQSRADLLLTRDELGALPAVLAQARRTRRIVAQNLAWAIAYNVVAVPLALSGALTPWVAALGMGLSSVTVVLNALRLARTPQPPQQPLRLPAWSQA